MANLQTLPYVDIQPDALDVFDDVSQLVTPKENVWVSCYKIGETSVHGKISLSKAEEGIQGVSIKSSGGVEGERQSHTAFTVSCKALGIEKQHLRFPRQTITPPAHKSRAVPLSVNTVDLSPDGSQLVYGGPDGYCYVHTLSTLNGESKPRPPLELKGHVGDVLDVKWFPSGSVVLTAAMDATIRIFSAENGINPRTLKGHKRAVTSLDILGVGKNVVSGSKDGSIKLWDVSKGVCLTSIYTEGFAGVEKIKTGKSAKIVRDRLSASGSIDGAFEPKHTDGEIQSDTGDTLLFAGLSSSAGNLALYDLASKDPILRTFPHIPLSTSSLPNYPTAAKGGAIHSIAYDADRYLLASGSARGVVVVRDVRMLDKDGSGALHVFRRTEAAINDLAFVPSASSSMIDLVLAPESGLPCRLGIPLDGGEPVSCVEEYAGWEPLSIESVSVGREGQVWVSGAEGGIRRY